MSQQISLRMPERLLKDAKAYASTKGYGNVQALVAQAVREKLYDEELTPREWRSIEKALHGKTIPGDQVLNQMRRKGSGK